MPSKIAFNGLLMVGMDGLSATRIIMTEYPESRRPTVIAMTAK
jgi:CheY-like chemotaxis protein